MFHINCLLFWATTPESLALESYNLYEIQQGLHEVQTIDIDPSKYQSSTRLTKNT